MATIDTLLSNATKRNAISQEMKAFFRREAARAKGHVQVALRRALDASMK